MSGHSKWAGIKHKKGAIDAKRGKLFTRIIREIAVAAKSGGSNPINNPRLRKAMDQAKEANMPQENIKKAIQRGTGELPGVSYEETVYEGYGPGGVAIIVEVTTDNKNRTTSELRKTFSNSGGNMGESGSVAWMFSKKGSITVEKSKYPNEDELMSIALDLGAEDVQTDEDNYEIIITPENFEAVKTGFEKKNIPMLDAEVTLLPKTYIKLTGKEAEQMISLMNNLEDSDDVTNVSANFDIPKEILEKAGV